MTKLTLEQATERFYARAVPDENGCWVWAGEIIPWDPNTRRGGYGLAHWPGLWGGGKTTAHRVSYGLSVGHKPSRYVNVCHACDVRLCVNPEHLFVGSPSDNTLDMLAKSRDRYSLYGPTGTISGRPPAAVDNWALPPETRQEVRDKYARGGVRQADLAREYGVSQSSIHRMIRETP